MIHWVCRVKAFAMMRSCDQVRDLKANLLLVSDTTLKWSDKKATWQHCSDVESEESENFFSDNCLRKNIQLLAGFAANITSTANITCTVRSLRTHIQSSGRSVGCFEGCLLQRPKISILNYKKKREIRADRKLLNATRGFYCRSEVSSLQVAYSIFLNLYLRRSYFPKSTNFEIFFKRRVKYYTQTFISIHKILSLYFFNIFFY